MSEVEYRGYTIRTRPCWTGGVEANIYRDGREVFAPHARVATDRDDVLRMARNCINNHIDPPSEDDGL